MTPKVTPPGHIKWPVTLSDLTPSCIFVWEPVRHIEDPNSLKLAVCDTYLFSMGLELIDLAKMI